ncbi:MAG TPA: hypothetical protein VHY31_27990 [Streptosporangiaceae bacterium]|nr:hypothetical protein [Streptosporangiaceae bacterium]
MASGSGPRASGEGTEVIGRPGALTGDVRECRRKTEAEAYVIG